MYIIVRYMCTLCVLISIHFNWMHWHVWICELTMTFNLFCSLFLFSFTIQIQVYGPRVVDFATRSKFDILFGGSHQVQIVKICHSKYINICGHRWTLCTNNWRNGGQGKQVNDDMSLILTISAAYFSIWKTQFNSQLTITFNSNSQSICTIVEDLHLLKRKVYFWHWSKEPMGVLCRLDSKMFALFRDAQSEDELLKSVSIENGKLENFMRIPIDAIR